MKIVIDTEGGDYAPYEAVNAAIIASDLYDDLHIILTGRKDKINEVIAESEYIGNTIEVVDCDEIITNEDVPTEAIKKKTNSSLVKAFDILKSDDEVVGLISAGSTGAVLTGAFLKIGRIKGVSRPALCPILPTENGGKVMLMDAGANVDCKPINICHFALMASAYMRKVCDIENPRVALLSIGTEDKKGNEFTHECFEELKKLPINFVGNMEARDFMSGKYDVVVTDGFNGNILLKSVEGTATFIMKQLKQQFTSKLKNKIGAMFLKKSLQELKNKLDFNNYGGSPFLGAKKLVIKNHGASDHNAFLRSIEQVLLMAESDLSGTIEREIAAITVTE